MSLERAEIEQVITAPLNWCAHPESLISMHVCGESMVPTIQNDALVVVDLAQNLPEDVNHELVLMSHRDLGFKVARFQQLHDCSVLIPANPSCGPLDISDTSKWGIIGKVLWWVSKDKPHA